MGEEERVAVATQAALLLHPVPPGVASAHGEHQIAAS
ncbi:hypothetical protein Q9966_013198 [Columba livia]|nr:hypothetical protein Q9966_013198 [Columba livia]